MKTTLLNILTVIILFLIPNINFGQAPDLGTASGFALFTAVGAFTNIGTATYVTGDAGTNAGEFSAFPPGTIVGEIHAADTASAQAASDVDGAYSYLDGLTCGEVIGTTLGNDQVLTPNIYCLEAASTLNGDLTLDGQGDPNALFIFKINGALSTTTFSNVNLTNSASLCNVYWQINGAFELGDSSVFKGTLVVNGAISLLEGSTLLGRGLSRAGAISLHNNMVALGKQPLATIIAEGDTTLCSGESVTLTASVTDGVGPFSYLWSPGGLTDSSITVSPTASTSYTVAITAMNSCSAGMDTISVTVNQCECVCSAPIITSVDSVCGNTASMCWSSVPCATEYLVRWNILPDTKWIYTTITAPDTCRQFTNQFGDVNELQVASICESGDTSAYSPLVTWTDYLVCAAPANQVTSNVTATSADLSWNANPDANKYQVLYKTGVNKTTVKVNGTSLSLTGLPPSTTIKWKVKSRCESCGGKSWGSYSPFKSFTTAALKQFAPDKQSTSAMHIFPNPAIGNFTVNFNIGYTSQQSYTLAVQNIVGHVVIAVEGTLTDGLISQDISLTNGISNGIYFVTITAGDVQFRERLVVIRD